MSPAQSEILETLRRRLGDDAADEVASSWAADGVDAPRSDRLRGAELARIMAWRFDPNPRRRQIAIARLARAGYDVTLTRVRNEDGMTRMLREARS